MKQNDDLKNVSASIPEWAADRLSEFAKNGGRSFSSQLRIIIENVFLLPENQLRDLMDNRAKLTAK